MTRTPDPRITKAVPPSAGKPCGEWFSARFCRGPTHQPSLFPVSPEGPVGSLPKLRDLTWKPRKLDLRHTCKTRLIGHQACRCSRVYGSLSARAAKSASDPMEPSAMSASRHSVSPRDGASTRPAPAFFTTVRRIMWSSAGEASTTCRSACRPRPQDHGGSSRGRRPRFQGGHRTASRTGP